MGKHKRQDSDSEQEEDTSPEPKKAKTKSKHLVEEETPSQRLIYLSAPGCIFTRVVVLVRSVEPFSTDQDVWLTKICLDHLIALKNGR